MSSEGRSARIVRFEPFALDLHAGELHRDGLKVKLQDKPLRILELLLERPGDVVTRDELRQGLWPAETFVDFEGGLNTAVNKLRAALGDAAEGPRFVETVGRRGYRFIAPVDEPSSPDPSAPRGPASAQKRWLVVAAAAAVILAAAAGLLAWRVRARDEAARALLRSLAVLPLADLSGGSEPYLADGMTESLITELGKIRALKVISRTSVMRYKGTTSALPEVARELGVDAIVEGSVLRSGGRVRVTAQLVRARSDEQLWAQDYERDLGDLLSLQRELARAIAGEVRVRLTAGEEARLASGRSMDSEANDAYLKGRYYFHQAINSWSTEAWHRLMARSFGHYEEAIRRAPYYAQAHAALAQAYHWHASRIASPEFFAKAKAEARRAIALDETLGSAHAALAYVLHTAEWDWVGAEREYERALELEPAEAHHGYAILLSTAGRHQEAIRHIERAEVLDPMTLALKQNSGFTYLRARQYERAEAKFRLGLDLFPEAAPTQQLWIGQALFHQGRTAEGLAEIRKGVELFGQGPDSTAAGSILAWALAASGQRDAARKMLPPLEAVAKSGHWPNWLDFLIAKVYAALGNGDRTFVFLEKAFRRRSRSLMSFKCDPAFHPFRSDARYQDLVRRIGFPPSPDN